MGFCSAGFSFASKTKCYVWSSTACLLPEGSLPSADNVAALLLLAKEAWVGASRRLITLLSRGMNWERRAKWWEQTKEDSTQTPNNEGSSTKRRKEKRGITESDSSFQRGEKPLWRGRLKYEHSIASTVCTHYKHLFIPDTTRTPM